MIDVPGFALATRSGPRHGHVDRVILRGRQATFIGWSKADRVVLRGRDGETAVRPAVLREDVARTTGLAPQVGFEATLPFGDGHFTVICEGGDETAVYRAEPISTWKVRANRQRLLLRFAVTLVAISPALWRYWRRQDLAARIRIRDALGLRHVQEAAPLKPGLFGPPTRAPVPGSVTIVLPIYNAFDLLPEVLDRVLRHTDLPWRLIVIEDCSSDPALRPWLEAWVAEREAEVPGRIELILNAENRGFIGSVNSGLARALEIGAPVVLLNSDAFVPPGWASRLVRTLRARPRIASVTPMSNDAEIFSVPAICRRTELAPGQGDAIDAVARQFRPGVLTASSPPASASAWRSIPTTWHRCRSSIPPSAAAMAKRSTGARRPAPWAGGTWPPPIFSSSIAAGPASAVPTSCSWSQTNNAVIARRYPTYDAEVQEFIQTDPLVTARLALAVAWMAAGAAAVPIYLAHGLGGGAEHYLQARLRADLAEGRAAIVLRVGTGAARWQIEAVSSQGMVTGTTDDAGVLEMLLAPLARRHIVYSCGVGDRDPVTLPDVLLALRGSGEATLEVLVHDYFMLSPSYTLLDQHGRYRGPVPATDTDPAHQARASDGGTVSLAAWQAAWGRLMAAADRVVVFSASSQALIAAAYPGIADALRLEPHRLLHDLPVLTRPDGPRRVIGVLGSIGYQKGAAVVLDLGRLLEGRDDLGLVVIGKVDPAYRCPLRCRSMAATRSRTCPGWRRTTASPTG